MFGWFKKSEKEPECEHPGVSISIDYDKPSAIRCHFCDRVQVRYNTGIPLAEGLQHMHVKRFWVEPDYLLEQAIKTSPREFGDLRVEKWLRNNGFI